MFIELVYISRLVFTHMYMCIETRSSIVLIVKYRLSFLDFKFTSSCFFLLPCETLLDSASLSRPSDARKRSNGGNYDGL